MNVTTRMYACSAFTVLVSRVQFFALKITNFILIYRVRSENYNARYEFLRCQGINGTISSVPSPEPSE